MIKPELMRYLKSAVEVLEGGEATPSAELKILKTLSEFTAMEAKAKEEAMVAQTAD